MGVNLKDAATVKFTYTGEVPSIKEIENFANILKRMTGEDEYDESDAREELKCFLGRLEYEDYPITRAIYELLEIIDDNCVLSILVDWNTFNEELFKTQSWWNEEKIEDYRMKEKLDEIKENFEEVVDFIERLKFDARFFTDCTKDREFPCYVLDNLDRLAFNTKNDLENIKREWHSIKSAADII